MRCSSKPASDVKCALRPATRRARRQAGQHDRVRITTAIRASASPCTRCTARFASPLPEMLDGLDALLFDLQDVGVRVYTFVWTMALAMEACAEAGVRFVVLDRPNPVGGVTVEGPLLREGYESFVGLHPVPLRHGLTCGELARWLNTVRGIDCELEVVPWRRLAAVDVLGRYRAALGLSQPEFADARFLCGLPRDGAARRDQSLGGPRDDPSVRALRRPLSGSVCAARGAGRDVGSGRPRPSVSFPTDLPEARRRAVRRWSATRRGPRSLRARPGRRGHSGGGETARPERLRVASSAVRVRRATHADRHPLGQRSATLGDRSGWRGGRGARRGRGELDGWRASVQPFLLYE